MNDNEFDHITYILPREVINAIKLIAKTLQLSEDEAAVYLFTVALAHLDTPEQSELKTPPPD